MSSQHLSGDNQQQHYALRALLEELLDELGESYSNLVCANAALDTVNRDLDGCVSFVQRRRDRSLRAEAKEESEKEERNEDARRQEEEDLNNKELPGEIEKILAKARRVVSVGPSSAKREREAKAKIKAKTNPGSSNGQTRQSQTEKQKNKPTRGAAEEQKGSTHGGGGGENMQSTHQGTAAPKHSFKPLRLPARIRDLRSQAHQFGQDLLTHGQFVAGTSHLFNRQVSELFREDCAWPRGAAFDLSPSRSSEEGNSMMVNDDTVASELRALAHREGEMILRLERLEGMSHSEQAMLRADLKALLEKRQFVHRRMSALSQYGQQWKELAKDAEAEEERSEKKKKKKKKKDQVLLGKLTSGGKMNSLSMRWVPDSVMKDEDVATVVGRILQKSCLEQKVSKFQRKHEILTKARSLVQQKILQLRVEGKFMSCLLESIGNMRRDASSLFSPTTGKRREGGEEELEKEAEADDNSDEEDSDSNSLVDIGSRSVREAVALERLVALCRLHQQLYLDPQSKPQVGFFFRQSL